MLTLTTASAGSGKTYRLAQEFIRLALDPAQPRAFAGILAVTFTKKAAGEIKARVLGQLKAMAEGKMPLPIQSSRHTRELAGQVHRAILEQYDAFAVLTLDSFFQRIIRGFAIELDLPGNYRIQLDQDEVKELAVDRLLGRDSRRPEVRPLLRRMVLEQLEDDGKWNIRGRIADFAGQLFKSSFARYEPLLEQQHTLITDEVLNQIREERNRLDADLAALAATAVGVLVDMRQQSPVAVTANVQRIIEKLKTVAEVWKLPEDETQYIIKLLKDAGDPEIYFTKKDRTSQPGVLGSLAARVAPVMADVRAYIERNRSRYYTLQLLYDNLPDTLLISALSHELAAIREERNLFLLYQQALFLSRITAESSTPFIYDRVGLRLRNFLIDEMQDTSRDQWQALRPLLENSLASGEANLIVGDVKQAIYRWRDGDAGLMLGRIAEDLAGMVRPDRLEFNYRSLGVVVEFNNALVRHLPILAQNALSCEPDLGRLPAELERSILAQTSLLPQAFAGGEQRIPADKAERRGRGYVRLEFYPPKPRKKAGTEPEDAEPPMVEQRLLAWLDEAFSLGYGPGDICILVRRKAQASIVAEVLMRKQAEGDARYLFSSADSLAVEQAVTVRFLLAMLRVLAKEEDVLARLEVGYLYATFLKNDVALAERVYQHPPSREGLLEMLPAAVAQAWEDLTLATPALALETLAGLCGLDAVHEEQAFLLALLETAHAFEEAEGGNQAAFLTYWERKGAKLRVDMPATGDRIQIQTVHASKGLEYPVVLVPFADWKLDEAHHSELLWLPSPEPERYHGVALGAYAYGRRLRQSDFAAYAYEEALARALDALNLAYVAFTRAQRLLYIGAADVSKDMKAEEKEAGSLADLLYLFVKLDATHADEEPLPGVRSHVWGTPVGPEGRAEPPAARLEPEIRFPQRAKRPARPSPSVGLQTGLWDEDEILLRLFRTGEADGSPDERVIYQWIRDGVVTRARMQEVRETYDIWRALPQAAVLWGRVGAVLRCEPTLLDAEGRAFTPDRVLFEGGQAWLVQGVLRRESEEAAQAEEVLLGAARALRALGKQVRGAYRVSMVPFTVERLDV